MAALTAPEFKADAAGYYSYLRSLAFDLDLDFANEWNAWGLGELPLTSTGLRRNPYSVGPALLWSPFFLIAHAYVRVGQFLGFAAYRADGYSDPYYCSTALGTLTIGLTGAWLLVKTLSQRFGFGAAALAVLATILTSSTVYYLFVAPTMAHGLVFGVATATVWAWDRAWRVPSLRAWVILGGLVGLLSLTRWQCAVYVLLLLPLALDSLRRGTLRLAWLGAAVLAALLAFTPQMIAWKVLFGSYLTVPQPSSFFLLWPVHALDVLLHAHHGLFTYTPAMLIGAVGLLLSARFWPLLAVGGWLVFAASVWVNGSITDWAGSDSFGSRRFDLVMPFMALGFASVIRVLLQAPLVSVALLALGLVPWNLGLIALYRKGELQWPPFERAAQGQARQLYHFSDDILGRAAGAPGRALAYKVFVGEYIYYNLASDGTIDLASDEGARFLASGWSRPRRGETPAFRWAYYPEACFALPFEKPLELRSSLTARTLHRLDPQTMTIVVNGTIIGSQPLTSEWREVSFTVPAAYLVSGRNFLCLRFSRGADEQAEGSVAAAVSRLQLP